MRDNGFYEKLSKKEVARLERERKKLEKNLLGIKEIEQCPDALFVVDSRQETIAVKEAAKLKIPIIAIVDTNSDPDLIDYIIPGNDDALRSIRLFAETVADAILAGKALYAARVEAETKETDDKAAKEAAQRQAAKEAKDAVQLATKKQAEAAVLAATAEEESGEVKEAEAGVVEPAAAVEAAASTDTSQAEETDSGTAVPARATKKEEKKRSAQEEKDTSQKRRRVRRKRPNRLRRPKGKSLRRSLKRQLPKPARLPLQRARPRSPGESRRPLKSPDSEEPSAVSSTSD